MHRTLPSVDPTHRPLAALPIALARFRGTSARPEALGTWVRLEEAANVARTFGSFVLLRTAGPTQRAYRAARWWQLSLVRTYGRLRGGRVWMRNAAQPNAATLQLRRLMRTCRSSTIREAVLLDDHDQGKIWSHGRHHTGPPTRRRR